MNLTEFYSTPVTLLEKILSDVKWEEIRTVLEPSAGKGDIVDYITKITSEYPYYNTRIEINCIEKEEQLRNLLKGAGKRVVHDDFLSYHTYQQYDLIVMNPPFSEGDKHLMKALDMQEKTGGGVICILNAETIKNPYSNLRKTLVQRLKDANAEITYIQQAFSSAERTTDVEIAVIKVFFDKPVYDNGIYEKLKVKKYAETKVKDNAELVPNDFVEAIVREYEIEVESGLSLIREYKAMIPHLMPNLKEEDNKYSSPILELTCTDENKYVQKVRKKYWTALFADKRITGKMASKQQSKYRDMVDDLIHYDFSYHNIKELQVQMSKELVKSIEDCILDIFNTLSDKYSYYDGSNNIHYYNGWKSNKAYIINKKVIIPVYAWDDLWKKFKYDRYLSNNIDVLYDLEKALNYLNGGLTDGVSLCNELYYAENNQITKKIHCKYFTLDFYKKGTCHITFTNDELLKKLNIFGSQRKGWLPPCYGKKTYQDMTDEEKTVIDEFEGVEEYENICKKSDYYLIDDLSGLLQIAETNNIE